MLPHNQWVGGEKLEKMMDYLGITSEDLTPIVIPLEEEVSSGIQAFTTGMQRKTMGVTSSRAGRATAMLSRISATAA